MWGVATIIMFASAGDFGAGAQKPKAPPISKAVYWASSEPEVEVYLVEKDSGGFKLTVVSKKDLKVTYHTSINSYEPVDKELVPSNSGASVRTYEFQHHFSKMTIWMALEFTLDGKSVSGLTRTFFNEISTVVPNGHFNYGTGNKP